MHVQAQYQALSNMNVIRERLLEDGAWREVCFERSVRMSTYLLAFVVGDLEFVEERTRTGVPVRVYAPRGHGGQSAFAVRVGVRVLDYFAEYFDAPYPLPKMDMIAVPDFASGAMENWGLVTYRMTMLLFDEATSSLKTKQRVAYVIAHELAHQWFGNLVTMDWWSDLWLNEGFATWVGWLAVDHLFPAWDVWTEFVVDDLQAGLSLDSLRTSHAIEVPVVHPADISQIFDAISYSKGASVIRMLHAHLGATAFQEGLRRYIQTFQYRNAKTQDLWAALSDASGQDVQAIMHGWTRHMGVSVACICDFDTCLCIPLIVSRDYGHGDV